MIPAIFSSVPFVFVVCSDIDDTDDVDDKKDDACLKFKYLYLTQNIFSCFVRCLQCNEQHKHYTDYKMSN